MAFEPPCTPWSDGEGTRVLMTMKAWQVYHSAWIVCYGPDSWLVTNVEHLRRARAIVFG